MLFFVIASAFLSTAGAETSAVVSGPAPLSKSDSADMAEMLLEPEDQAPVPALDDPLEPLNRVFFHFNDQLFFLVLKPVSQIYRAVLPERIRLAFRNFFSNAQAPVRIVNNVLQGKLQDAGTESARFAMNSTFGLLGLGDFAGLEYGLKPHEEDFGQTLGVYGLGQGIYLLWPFWGPSTLRDSLGCTVDMFLNPWYHAFQSNTNTGFALSGAERVNDASLSGHDYELFKEMSVDPYIALRDAYGQNRHYSVSDQGGAENSTFKSFMPLAPLQERLPR